MQEKIDAFLEQSRTWAFVQSSASTERQPFKWTARIAHERNLLITNGLNRTNERLGVSNGFPVFYLNAGA